MGYMTFGEALKALKAGKKVRRVHWRDHSKFLFLSSDGSVGCPALGIKADTPVHPVICLYCPYDDGTAAILPGWTPLQCDMLTDDWDTVEEAAQ